MANLTGQILADRFRVLRMLGRGGMGHVYEVELLELPKRFAIKVLIAKLANDKDALLRFRREAELIARLNHPNLVEILDWYSLPDGTHFYVMEVLNGDDLSRRLKTSGPLSMSDVATLAKQCFSGLLEAHRQGAVHRDIKPANVFLTEGVSGLHIKIIDFGLARARDMAAITIYTQPLLIGTPAYMSPEQILGTGPVDETADTWAMAVLLYEAASGVKPFQGRYPDLITVIGKKQPVSLRVHRPEAPAAFADALAAALSPDKDTRLRSTAELAARVAAALDPDAQAVAAPVSIADESGPRQSPAVMPAAIDTPSTAPTKNERVARVSPVTSRKKSARPANLRRFLLAGGGVLAFALAVTIGFMAGGDDSKAKSKTPDSFMERWVADGERDWGGNNYLDTYRPQKKVVEEKPLIEINEEPSVDPVSKRPRAPTKPRNSLAEAAEEERQRDTILLYARTSTKLAQLENARGMRAASSYRRELDRISRKDLGRNQAYASRQRPKLTRLFERVEAELKRDVVASTSGSGNASSKEAKDKESQDKTVRLYDTTAILIQKLKKSHGRVVAAPFRTSLDTVSRTKLRGDSEYAKEHRYKLLLLFDKVMLKKETPPKPASKPTPGSIDVKDPFAD
jgi:serine/threonine protein kinase